MKLLALLLLGLLALSHAKPMMKEAPEGEVEVADDKKEVEGPAGDMKEPEEPKEGPAEPKEVEVEDDKKEFVEPADSEEVFKRIKDIWEEVKDGLEESMDDLEENFGDYLTKAKEWKEKIEKETVETVKEATKDVDTKVKRQELEKFFKDAHAALDKEWDIQKYIKGLILFMDDLREEVNEEKDEIYEALETVKGYWNTYKNQNFSAEAAQGEKMLENAQDMLMKRVELAKVAMGQIYAKYQDDIDYVIGEIPSLLKHIATKVLSLKTEDIINAIKSVVEAGKKWETDETTKEIIAKFEEFGKEIGEHFEKLNKGEEGEEAANKVQTNMIALGGQLYAAFQQEPYLPKMMTLFQPITDFVRGMMQKGMEVSLQLGL